MGTVAASPRSGGARNRRITALCALGAALAVALTLAHRVFARPGQAVAYPDGPSLYVNTYVRGSSYSNTILYYGARHSVSAARASHYVEVRTPDDIGNAIRDAAADAEAPLERITIASHGIPGGLILDRDRQGAPLSEWLLSADALLGWMQADVQAALTRDAVLVLESCDTSPIVGGAPAAEAVAFRRALSAALNIPADNVILFRGPAKYAWTLDGWVPRTQAFEIVFGDAGAQDPQA